MSTFFKSLEAMVVVAAESVRPPERLTVSEAAEKYRFLNNPGSYVGPWRNSMTPYLKEPMDVLTSHEYEGMILVSSAQSGKALALDTPLATPDGWTTMGKVKVGERVFGADGKPCNVTFATGVMRKHKCYNVVFDDGSEIVADAEHLWSVRDVRRGKNRTVTTQEMVDAIPRAKRSLFCVETASSLSLPEKELLLDPYILGAWLGDGHTANAFISVGRKDIKEFCKQVNARGFTTRIYKPNAIFRCFAVELRGPEGVPLSYYLSEIGVSGKNGKRIPKEYLRASEEQRRELLRGLLDTDGSLTGAQGRTVEFSASLPLLAEDVAELFLSLGYKIRRRVRETAYKKDGIRVRCSDAHYINAVCYRPEEMFSYGRKKAAIKRGKTKTVRSTMTEARFVKRVIPVDSVPVRCIQVDSHDHLYLAGKSLIPTHNTECFSNWLAYTMMCDPADMMLINTAQATARDFSMRRVDRMFRHSKEVGAKLIQRREADNVFDKRMTSGMMLTLSWPSINELSGRPVPRLWLTDYDRMDQDVDGEGTPYALAKARATTFRSHGMVVAESSPGFMITDPHWVPKSKHEAPPTEGILALYNSGDRRRWYWRCVSCLNAFIPSWSNIQYPESDDIHEASEAAVMVCPHCGQVYAQDPTGVPGKAEMNQRIVDGGHAAWLAEGQTWLRDGTIEGKPIRSKTASFWLEGVAAVFNDWHTLVAAYLQAEREYEETGSEQTLKAVVNTKLGLPYLPKKQATARMPETLRSRANDYGKRVVPWGVRFLIATVDVQKNRFVVQVHGIGADRDIWIVDRFEVKYSKRPQEDRVDQVCYLNPGAYPEDWRLLLEEVMLKTYPLMDESGRHMSIRMTFSDSGGKEGVTQNAYNFVRWLRRGYEDGAPQEEKDRYPWKPGMAPRFQLIKGDSNMGAPRIRLGFPDSQRKDRHAGARGEIPVLFINTNSMKNAVDKMLDRTDPGGRINFPNWLDTNFYKELVVEVKNKKGEWENPNDYRNESWDLLVYCASGVLHHEVGIETIDWDRPPTWAQEWDKNDLIFHPDGDNKPFDNESKKKYDLSGLANLLA